jgi:hypothetical protein
MDKSGDGGMFSAGVDLGGEMCGDCIFGLGGEIAFDCIGCDTKRFILSFKLSIVVTGLSATKTRLNVFVVDRKSFE